MSSLKMSHLIPILVVHSFLFSLCASSHSYHRYRYGSSSEDCNDLQENRYVSGRTYKSKSEVTLDFCCRECANSHNCRGFLWRELTEFLPYGDCYLKSRIAGKRKRDHYYFGKKSHNCFDSESDCNFKHCQFSSNVAQNASYDKSALYCVRPVDKPAACFFGNGQSFKVRKSACNGRGLIMDGELKILATDATVTCDNGDIKVAGFELNAGTTVTVTQAPNLARFDCPDQAPCRSVRPVANFDRDAYLGTWYEIQKGSVPFEQGQKCNRVQYTLKDDGKILVRNTAVVIRTRLTIETVGEATIKDTSIGLWEMRFKLDSPAANYGYILATDYTGYAIVFACFNNGTTNIEAVWILSRTPTFTNDELSRVKQITEKLGFDTSAHIVTDQQSCGYE